MKRLNNLYYSKRIKELLAELQTAGTTLVVAPMGYGKTLAVQYFLQEQERCGKKVLRQSIYGAGAEAFWQGVCHSWHGTELGAALWLQFAVFLIVSILALIATRPLARKMLDKTIVPTNADRVLHHEAKVTETVDNENATGAVYIDGKTWTARSEDGNIIPKGKMARIVRMEGVKLYVRESKEPSERRE